MRYPASCVYVTRFFLRIAYAGPPPARSNGRSDCQRVWVALSITNSLACIPWEAPMTLPLPDPPPASGGDPGRATPGLAPGQGSGPEPLPVPVPEPLPEPVPVPVPMPDPLAVPVPGANQAMDPDLDLMLAGVEELSEEELAGLAEPADGELAGLAEPADEALAKLDERLDEELARLGLDPDAACAGAWREAGHGGPGEAAGLFGGGFAEGGVLDGLGPG